MATETRPPKTAFHVQVDAALFDEFDAWRKRLPQAQRPSVSSLTEWSLRQMVRQWQERAEQESQEA